MFPRYRSRCHVISEIGRHLGLAGRRAHRLDLTVNLSCVDIGFVSQCSHLQIKVVKIPHISTYFAVVGVRCSVVFFAVFSKVIEVVLIYSKYHLLI